MISEGYWDTEDSDHIINYIVKYIKIEICYFILQ